MVQKRDIVRARTEGDRVTMALSWTGTGYVLVGDCGGNRYRLVVDRPEPLVTDDLRVLMRAVVREIEGWL